MADSDDDSERRPTRDKFRRERSDVENRRRPGDKREPFDDRLNSSGYSNNRLRSDRRGPNEYRSFGGSRDRPQLSSELPIKRPRREWNDDNRPSYRQKDSRSGLSDEDSNYRPPLMPFKKFLDPLDDLITDEEALLKYKEYKESFNKRYIEEFFESHKFEEWLREKYHPDHINLFKEQIGKNIRHRLDVFLDLFDKGLIDNQAVQMDNSDSLIKLMDAVVIKLSGGTDEDLAILDQTDLDSPYENTPKRVSNKSPDIKLREANDHGSKSEEGEEDSDFESEDGEERRLKQDFQQSKASLLNNSKIPQPTSAHELLPMNSHEWTGVSNSESEGEENSSKRSKVENQEEEFKDNMINENNQDDQSNNTTMIENEICSANNKLDEDVPTPTTAEAPGGGCSAAVLNDQMHIAQATVASAAAILGSPLSLQSNKSMHQDKIENGENNKNVKQTEPPRNLHKTVSIFFRCLQPTITRKELEEICSSQPGYLRLAIYDPMPEHRFTRHAWATFTPDVNIKKICWALNTSPLLREKWQASPGTSGELCATVNRELAQRVRPVTPITRHKPVMRNDLILASRLIAQLDANHKLWQLPEVEEKKPSDNSIEEDAEKPKAVTNACPVPGLPGVYSANPLMRNLTDYLIDETGEEEALLMRGGLAKTDSQPNLTGDMDNQADPNERPERIAVETDLSLVRALDRLLIYLRIVYSIDYYSATVYQLEDSMPHRCGIFHARGDRGLNSGASGRGQTLTVSKREVLDYIENFNVKIAHLLESPSDLSDEEIAKLGAREPEKAIEDFIEANIQKRTSKKKPFKVVWICSLSDKKFREPIFVRKHILNKHMDKVEAAKKDNALFFNNFLRDPKRPSLPDTPKHLISHYYPSVHTSFGDRYNGGGNIGTVTNQGQMRGRSGAYRSGGGYRSGYRNSNSASLLISSQYGNGRGRNQPGLVDYYDSSSNNQHQAMAVAAAAAALYPNTPTADLFAVLGAGTNAINTGGNGGGRVNSPREYSGSRNYHCDNYINNSRKRSYANNDRYRRGGGSRPVISYNDLDDPGNE